MSKNPRPQHTVEHAPQGDYIVVRYDNGRRRVEPLSGHPRRFPTREAAQAALDAHLSAGAVAYYDA